MMLKSCALGFQQSRLILNRYELWEDDATSPTLIWSLAGELSRHNIDNYAQQNSAVNTKVAVLDPKIATQTPGLSIPDAKVHGPTVLGTPTPEEKDFRDDILIFPISNIPAIYVYLSKIEELDSDKYTRRQLDRKFKHAKDFGIVIYLWFLMLGLI
ncbi:Colicin-D [Xenorhabdus beddingii]|uniref:Colicin-D n=1 Tax=Xenorhabdus beddingii TaxID=40578 RepID=A0A1Y2SMY8_9GAMM|nr:S-type pyocin domain-containing protein [Xenorhabdus beddingii]OTA20401.1 Colicin-D [Xenorhabdus beddingii]